MTHIRLSVAQASSSLKHVDTCMTPTYTTHTFVTEAFHLVTYVQLFCSSSNGFYTAIPYSY